MDSKYSLTGLKLYYILINQLVVGGEWTIKEIRIRIDATIESI